MPLPRKPIDIVAFSTAGLGGLAAVVLDGAALEAVLRAACLVVGGLGCVLLFRSRPEEAGGERKGWTLLAGSMGFWCAGIFAYFLFPRSFFSGDGVHPPDWFFIAGLALALLGMPHLPSKSIAGGAGKILLLDQLIAALAVGGVYWHLALVPNFSALSSHPIQAVVLQLGYALVEFVMIQMAIELLIRGPSRPESASAYKWVASAFMLLLGGDVLMEFDRIGAGRSGRIVLHLTNLGFALCVLKCAQALGQRRGGNEPALPPSWGALWGALMPLAWITLPGLAFSVLFLLGGASTAWGVFLILPVVVVLVVIRQRYASWRSGSSLRSALLTAILPGMLGFQLLALLFASWILGYSAEAAARTVALSQVRRLSEMVPVPSPEYVEGHSLLPPGSRFIVAARERADSGNCPECRKFGWIPPDEFWIRPDGSGHLARPGELFPEIVTWVELAGDPRRALVVSTPLSSGLATAQMAGFAVILLFVLAGGLGTLIVFHRAGRLVEPIERLTQVAAAVQSGDLSVRTGVVGVDEVGRLGAAMDSMVDRLGQMLSEQKALAEKAREANLAKSRFLANMSHEIRTPLNGVVGMADLLDPGGLDSRDRELVVQLKASAENLRRLVGDILDLSKIEAERVAIEFAPFSPSAVVDEVVALFGPVASAKGVGLSARWLSPRPAAILGDAARFRQILSNLVSNALKFTERGEIAIRVKGSFASPPSLIVEVADTGTGIAAESHDRIWQTFAQADESTTRKFGGTGLGLTISRSLARLMGGDLFLARSAPGEGSLFVLSIPLHETDELAAGDSAHDVPDGVPTGLRVLVAEDNRVNQRVIIGFLRKLGCETTLVEDGQAAVEAVLRESPDFVLMDVHMPRMDGIEAVKSLRDAGYAGRIWALTASALGEERDRCIEAGMDGFLAKPIGLSDLKAALGRAFQKLD